MSPSLREWLRPAAHDPSVGPSVGIGFESRLPGNCVHKVPSDSVSPDAAISLDLDRAAPRVARDHVTQVGEGLSPGLREAVELLTSELVTRAVQQCRPPSGPGVELRVWMGADVVRVEVRAPGKLLSLPLKRVGPDYDVVLLRQVADRWSIETAQYPACMWFEINRHRPDLELASRST